ncbi:hypothetical protein PTSG_05832 [Salpingoeca rosetta]|uniref:RING-type domain-containing protein n=1 Tax=Salpingoeca rosetta (strain ATCC 50818 / BSB-021) TaxID=946362 RepID=F2UCX3_SALR5|nr:uncharacterized protein PTSG_05832 [Salpingoeca rosetta]EGD74468.1 hypothetical protein PTSG_05832 [Salpingoeca rosetta]|eukprot:XP_004992725.1 hypothetical protein PTSG_05832 [Salpingoeca rosetta]
MADFHCNKCRGADLGPRQWATRCSHLLCDACGQAAMEAAKASMEPVLCPVCKTPLIEKHDLVNFDPNPSEQHRSMILAGLSPALIIEIAGRALSFHTYQMSLQTHLMRQELKTKTSALEAKLQKLAVHGQSEMDRLHTQLQAAKEELHRTVSELQSARQAFAEKSRQHNRLQMLYDDLRRKAVALEATQKTPVPRHSQQRPIAQPHEMRSSTTSSVSGFVTTHHLAKPGLIQQGDPPGQKQRRQRWHHPL